VLDFQDHLLAALLVLALPPRAWWSFRTLARATPERQPALRRRMYLAAMLTQWVLAAFLIWHWLASGRDWLPLGLSTVVTPGGIGVAVGLLIVITLMILQTSGSNRARFLERARARLEHVKALLPHTITELRWFGAVAITAGVCEELMFRGFLIWYLMHFTGVVQAALLSSLSFGIGHAYQGPRYVVITGLLGAFLAGIYLLSGSLILSMTIHALMDLNSGWIGYQILSVGAEPRGAGALPPDGTAA
jgi:uncharacterized protein